MDEAREAMTTEEQATEPAETGMQEPQAAETECEEKTFTQEEVNEIVRRRLAKEREKFTSLMDSEGEKKLIEREKAVMKRELRMDALDKLRERHLPDRLADLVDYSNEESYTASFEKLCSVFESAIMDAVNQVRDDMLKGHTPHTGAVQISNNIRDAFRPKI